MCSYDYQYENINVSLSNPKGSWKFGSTFPHFQIHIMHYSTYDLIFMRSNEFVKSYPKMRTLQLEKQVS